MVRDYGVLKSFLVILKTGHHCKVIASRVTYDDECILFNVGSDVIFMVAKDYYSTIYNNAFLDEVKYDRPAVFYKQDNEWVNIRSWL